MDINWPFLTFKWPECLRGAIQVSGNFLQRPLRCLRVWWVATFILCFILGRGALHCILHQHTLVSFHSGLVMGSNHLTKWQVFFQSSTHYYISPLVRDKAVNGKLSFQWLRLSEFPPIFARELPPEYFLIWEI